MLDRLIWNGWFRAICFWALVVGVPAAADYYFESLDFTSAGSVVWNAVAMAGTVEGDVALKELSGPHFALSLAAALGATGAGFLVAYLIIVNGGVKSGQWAE